MVLDEQHGELAVVADLLDEAAELLDLLVVEPARRLVEQQQLRLRHERAGELDPLQRPERQAGDRALDATCAEADVVERLERLGLDVAAARVRADEHVLEHRHRPEELDVLEGARDPAARRSRARAASAAYSPANSTSPSFGV